MTRPQPNVPVSDSRNRRQVVLRVLILFAGAAALVAAVLWLRFSGRATDDTGPVNPNEVMGTWLQANPEQRRATAELLLDEMQSLGRIGPKTQARLDEPGGRQKLVEELTLALDAAGSRARPEYVSPSLSITFTATRLSIALGWRE